MVKYACKKCKRILTSEKCPVCKIDKASKTWKGRVIIFNPDKSRIAKTMGITESGEYAIRI